MYLVLNTQDTLVQTPAPKTKQTKNLPVLSNFRFAWYFFIFFKEEEEEHLPVGRSWVQIGPTVHPILQAEALWMTLGMASCNDEGLCRHALKSLDLNYPKRFFYVCVFHMLIFFYISCSQ